MNQTIRSTKVLDYYDGVLVFTAEGDDGQQYVGSIVDTTDGVDRYLVKTATSERIKDLKKGKVDLRSLLLENPCDQWYLTFDGHAPEQPLELQPQSGSIEATDFLPSDGYFLGDEDNAAQERLIEKWLPINEVSIEAVREGGALAGHPPVNQLHVWWARRPLIASRAAVAASMLPTDADRSRFLTNIGTTTEVVTARRKMDAIKAEGSWSDVSFPNRRAFLHNPDFLVDAATTGPVVIDVTAGGGSIPFEAGRLGFRTIANELNPVACFILRATCQWPQQHGYALLDDYRECAEAFQARVNELLAGVYPDEYAPDCAGGNCPQPQHQNGKNSAVRAQRYAQTYLWARTAACPACRKVIPLSPNWRLDNKGTGIRVEPDADPIGLSIVHDRQACSDCRSKDKGCHLATLYPDHRVSDGTVTRAIATCPACWQHHAQGLPSPGSAGRPNGTPAVLASSTGTAGGARTRTEPTASGKPPAGFSPSRQNATLPAMPTSPANWLGCNRNGKPMTSCPPKPCRLAMTNGPIPTEWSSGRRCSVPASSWPTATASKRSASPSTPTPPRAGWTTAASRRGATWQPPSTS